MTKDRSQGCSILIINPRLLRDYLLQGKVQQARELLGTLLLQAEAIQSLDDAVKHAKRPILMPKLPSGESSSVRLGPAST